MEQAGEDTTRAQLPNIASTTDEACSDQMALRTHGSCDRTAVSVWWYLGRSEIRHHKKCGYLTMQHPRKNRIDTIR